VSLGTEQNGYNCPHWVHKTASTVAYTSEYSSLAWLLQNRDPTWIASGRAIYENAHEYGSAPAKHMLPSWCMLAWAHVTQCDMRSLRHTPSIVSKPPTSASFSHHDEDRDLILLPRMSGDHPPVNTGREGLRNNLTLDTTGNLLPI